MFYFLATRCLYCVKVDIETCYDTVDGHRLFALISDIFNKVGIWSVTTFKVTLYFYVYFLVTMSF